MSKPKFYVMLPQRNFAKTRAFAEAADSLGYYGVGLGDHLFVHRGDMQLPDEPLLECYTTTGAIAAVTQRDYLEQLIADVGLTDPEIRAAEED